MTEASVEERAAIAGARGRHAAPMSTARRGRAYRAQTGKPDLTPKQRRRANKKLIAELKRGWAVQS